MESFLISSLVITANLFAFRYMYLIKDKIRNNQQKIDFLNHELREGRVASLDKFRSNARFSEPDVLIRDEFLSNPLYRETVNQHRDLTLKSKQFWKLEGLIYLCVFVISTIGLVAINFFFIT